MRCSALELALTEPSLATLQEYYTLRLLGLVNDGAISMKPDDTGLSSDTSVITSGSQMGIAGPSVNLAQLDQPDALIDNNDDSYFHELFDFNSAALPLSFDIDDGVTTPFAEEATKDVSTAGQNPIPPTSHTRVLYKLSPYRQLISLQLAIIAPIAQKPSAAVAIEIAMHSPTIPMLIDSPARSPDVFGLGDMAS